ncbi:META domain-containing protein [Bizionia gelidisalsuginis]|uniref:META domain-containing protein n=1 Tax=Bizionia gelidisalsuginis TaxID=291188 RepID=A0ABY3MBL7_9FLAO|nr:META domain-containing protein [Bizionia gelidisalsuginis]TYC14211.1 META domain-containing protein [Bizionia gelidisalsuginis]
MKTKIFTVLLIATVIMGCKSDKKNATEMSSPDTSMVDITDTQWTLMTLEGTDLENAEQNGQVIHFTLVSEGNRVSGFAGCNTFTGNYTIEEGNRISFNALATTRMACPDAKIDEKNVLSVFEMTDNYTVSGDKLMLNKAKRAPLAVFSKSDLNSQPITQKHWKLKTLQGKEVTRVENQDKDIYFMLQSTENRVEGFAGCNSITGSYTLEQGNRITFTNVATTMMACPDVKVNEAEFLKIFEIADNYTINGDELSLNVGRRAPLAVFEAVK